MKLLSFDDSMPIFSALAEFPSYGWSFEEWTAGFHNYDQTGMTTPEINLAWAWWRRWSTGGVSRGFVDRDPASEGGIWQFGLTRPGPPNCFHAPCEPIQGLVTLLFEAGLVKCTKGSE